MVLYRVLGFGGKPTDASMIFPLNPYKEMANMLRLKITSQTVY